MSKRCFVIGPMSGENRATLKWLAYDVIKPLLPDEFEVETPDVQLIGNIMTHVIKACDRAHLVIANTTGNNPNVLYEIAVLDAMGRACIPVKIAEDEKAKKDLMPFDRAAYRYFTISKSPSKRAETDDLLRKAITEALAIREVGDMYQNPLTDFFGVPLSSFSSAYALARGYYFNLLKPAVTGILKGQVTGTAFDAKAFSKKVVEVIIPPTLDEASRTNVDTLVNEKGLLKVVTVEAPGRKILLYEWTQQTAPNFRWADIPTAMALLRETVLMRRGRDANPSPSDPDYKEIERDEIDQFERALHGFIERDLDSGALRTAVKVERRPLPR
jgi:hypothetical protein